MAVYTDISDIELATFLADFDLGAARTFKGIAEGVENSNFLLETETGRYILTVYEKRVRAADLPFFMGVMGALNAAGFPCPLPVTARDGNPLRQMKGKPAALVTFLSGMSPRAPTPAQCRAIGAALARMHAALAGFAMTRPNDLSLSSWRGLFAGRTGEADALAPGLASLIAQDLDALEAGWPKPSSLPEGVIHADLFPDNAFFLGDQVSGFIDFYFACSDWLAYDIAVCLNAWAFETRGEYNVTKGRALLAGYESVRPLEPAEREALPLLAMGAAMRFFLTRLNDWAATPPGALVRPTNPLDYAERLGFHRNAKGLADYGG